MTQVIKNLNVDVWKSAILHVIKIEPDYWARDHLLEEEMKQILIKFSR
jgi:hypothetical protein